MTELLFAIFYLAHFFVPGYCLLRFFRFHRHLFFLSLSLSYLLHHLILAVCHWFNGPPVLFTLLNIAVLFSTGLLLLWSGPGPWTQRTGFAQTNEHSKNGARTGPTSDWAEKRGVWLAGTIPIVLVLVYLTFDGPYLEVPADIWQHLGSMQDLFNRHFIAAQPFDDGIREFLFDNPNTWYFTLPWLADLLNVRVEALIQPLSLVNSAIFLTGIYIFSLHTLENLPLKRTYWLLASALSVAFCFLHFGVNIFSYVRYYVAAPAFLNHLVFLGSILVFWDVIRGLPRPGWGMVFVAVSIMSMALVHPQEAIFAGVMTSGLAIYFLSTRPWRHSESQHTASLNPARLKLGWIICSVILIGAVVLLCGSLMMRNPVGEAKDFGKFLRPLSYSLPFLKNLYVAQPAFHAYHAVTVWGISVYVLFLLHLKFFRASPILVVALLTPLLTIFNPLFVEFFLRFKSPEPIYRFIYIVPLYQVGAALVASSLQRLANRTHRISRFISSAILVVLVVTLLPLTFPGIKAHYSRVSTLQPVAQDNTPAHWQDLLIYLRSLEVPRKILTDPITGYMTRGLTPHAYSGDKYHDFHWSDYKDFNKDLEQDDVFDLYIGWLFIVNQREGALSRNGMMSGHWPADVLKIKKHYSSALFDHIARNADRFRILWQAKEITVYEIIESNR